MRVLLAFALLAAPAAAQERQEGYYYPTVTSTESFTRTIRPAQATREERIAMAATLTAAEDNRDGAPRFVAFTKGAAAEKLILVALEDDVFRTLFRARAVLAELTGRVREAPFFQSAGLAFDITFLDLIKTLNFESLVVSDGATWAHRIEFAQ